MRRGREAGAPVALARRTPRRGRTRGSGAWPARSVQAAGRRVARRSQSDTVAALASRRRSRAGAPPNEGYEGRGSLSQDGRAAGRATTRAPWRRNRGRDVAVEVSGSGLVQSRPSRTLAVPVTGHVVIERGHRRYARDGARGDR